MQDFFNTVRRIAIGVLFAFIAASGYGAEWSLSAVQKRLGLTECENLTNLVTITDGTNSLVIKPGYRKASLNGTTLWFNGVANPDYKKVLTLADADVLRFIEPILKGTPTAVTGETFRVFIDPGHGGEDGGAVSKINGQLEKDLVLDISERLGAYLEAAGASVCFSRTNDVFLTLGERSNLAASQKADIFVSIHANTTGGASARGPETFSLTLAGYESTSAGGTIQAKERPGNTYDHDSSILGYYIHSKLPKRKDFEDRGFKHARFQVLRQAPCPAVLIETGFLSNGAETQSLASPRFRERIAKAISEGVIEYMRRAMRKDGEK